MAKIFYPELSYRITGVLYKTHNELGRYCSEKQYADSIENNFKKLKIDYEREMIIPIGFEGEFKGRNKVDFLVGGKIIIEIKAKKIITKEDYFQTRRYLSILNKKLAILVNFRSIYLSPKRILNPNSNE
ncbi:hypothetical protein A2954_07445 [Candidatus Roizmanbacteria bacterium RIFCSPLOWO2_01_FULL_37_12]|uniref:GxxExxY protein n=1 Tax=Candidatus Roizmanbacteria bacterium RIFCSPLOWO2_01_FULL_37_12 TaxID=1802056 RepID=A0A1F7IE94_9BACT|nr:MAG: hypothetical protein A2954_07445 [Candidatus Roizmanbacteria bacterium RIFCSPLOWO2_01_FULL_37_12]